MIGEAIRRRRESLRMAPSDLARLAGITRQALFAIEQGAMPKADTAVRLAKALGTTVEDLLLQPTETLWAGTPSQYARWARVRGRLVLYPSSDWHADVAVEGSRVAPLTGARDPDRVAVIAGCDPTLPELARRFEAEAAPWGVIVLDAASQEALRLLQSGLAHVAGVHIEEPAGYNRPAVEAMGIPAHGIRAVIWEMGLAARTGSDLERWPEWWQLGKMGFRPPGSGARRLLDDEAKRLRLPPASGAAPVFRSHLESARAVAEGAVKAAVMTRSAAALFGLPFAPWRWEPFDWVITAPAEPAAERLLGALTWLSLRHWLGQIPGYDTGETGQTAWTTAGARSASDTSVTLSPPKRFP